MNSASFKRYDPIVQPFLSCRLRPLRLACALLAGLALPAGSALAAESIAIGPSADATLLEVNPDNSAGGSPFFLSGTTQNGPRNRALLQFDIASSVPAGSRITAVGLNVEVTRVPGDGFEASLFGLHRVFMPWGEGGTVVVENPGGLGAPAMPGDTTWNNRFHGTTPEAGVPWSTPGGAAGIDFNENFSSSSFIYGLGVYNFEGTLDMISDVQFWLDNPSANHGWMLISAAEDLRFTARRFASREDANGGGPVLFIDYEPVPEPGTWALIIGGVTMLALWRRRYVD